MDHYCYYDPKILKLKEEPEINNYSSWYSLLEPTGDNVVFLVVTHPFVTEVRFNLTAGKRPHYYV